MKWSHSIRNRHMRLLAELREAFIRWNRRGRDECGWCGGHHHSTNGACDFKFMSGMRSPQPREPEEG